MKKEKIVLIGGGGHCKSLIDIIELQDRYEIIGIVDKKERLAQRVLGYEIIGCDDDLQAIFKECKNALIAIGHTKSNEIRVKYFEKLKAIGYALPSIISPLAYASKHSTLGEGSVVMHHALINADAKVGKNCIVNSKALIEHDAVVEDNCHISTGAIINGGVHVKANTFVGSNATSKEYIQIDKFIKAGSVAK
ncbi:MAG: acetyltransferase [Sulfurimonas sp.]|uniref:acetyltransferase n=1 Tax=Sulfurimonas sp. TaxID=2022749 RepID=UPI0025F76D9F|nr:acetyltransferase [Sulfurimonas sp.]MCK9455428.1 acetyltransferase [Sulfurimonas sp.]